MAPGNGVRRGRFSLPGGLILLFGLVVLALGLFSADSYFRGETCNMGAMGLALLFPIYAGAIVTGLTMLVLAWVRPGPAPTARLSAPGIPTPRPRAIGTPAQRLLLLPAVLLLIYGGMNAFWSVWLVGVIFTGHAGQRSALPMLLSLLWNLVLVAAGLGLLKRARR